MILRMIDTAVEALTLTSPNNGPSEIRLYEDHLVRWLHSTRETREPSPPERAPGPLLSSQPTAPTTSTSDNAELTNTSTVPATYVSSTAAVQAPQPQSTQQPAFLHPVTPHQLPVPAPALPYHLPAPPMLWNTQHRGLVMQQPVYQPHNPYMYHGPVIGPAVPQPGMLLPPPQLVHQPFHQPIVVVQPTPLVNPRSSLPPARRQASQSEWAPGGRKFNIAEWAQEHRPRTPQSSTNTAAQRTNNIAPIAPNYTATARYGPGVNVMYPRGSGEASEQLRSLTSTGTPTYSAITESTTFPFEVAATNTRPVTGGVLRISNVSKAEI